MITNPTYKKLAGDIAQIFCSSQQNNELCINSVQERILSSFNDTTFKYFLENIQKGRMYILKLSNWHSGNNCRQVYIDVKYTDVLTGIEKTGYWYYTAENCQEKQFFYPDLNNQINKHFVLLDPPITSKQNSEITRGRLVYSPGATSYNIVFTNTGGGGTPAPPKIVVNTPIDPINNLPGGSPSAPQMKTAGGLDDLFNFLSNPIVLLGLGVAGYYIFKK